MEVYVHQLTLSEEVNGLRLCKPKQPYSSSSSSLELPWINLGFTDLETNGIFGIINLMCLPQASLLEFLC